MSLRALADRIGVSPATLSQIENGKTGLTIERLDRIAGALEMSAFDILEAGSVPTPPSPSKPARVDSSSGSAGRGWGYGDDISGWRIYEPLSLPTVLNAALEEILTVGYHGTSMREISKRCGLSVPGIYNYFDSKQAILMAVLEVTMNELEWRTRGALREGREKDVVTRFCLLIENLALFHTHRRELGFIGTSEMRALDAENRKLVVEKRNWQQAMVDEQVLEAADAGLFRVQHPADASRAVVTMCTALATWWRPGGRMSASDIARLYIEYALDLMRYDRSVRENASS